ncbi:diaminobutyrate aminotransferase apoenzyme [Cribrihabitans marinus]|uniref:Diaminobutyrate--2-oxoglutarate transaminase n=1 Tax=Cribrihabitans marinus TaxID=1227549 RepID=A0A1H6RJP7_9RHOB|nr:diaminobutyrate--2-oxoglutarate transaminase [Cribrihabitans marinus]GGH20796.1 diaminobutyrate--2-oxoglutarate transaminase [Cribrihabitans marinus]SEI52737.1 diaminobutyrate aminotransferase apoenzyme [Cribrihabitans marinus]
MTLAETGTEKQSIFKRRESKVRSYCRNFDTVFTRAQGSELTDEAGRTYIDFLAGCSSVNYGHNDPDMKEALIAHIAADGLSHGLDFHSDAKASFLTAFEQHILKPRGMDHKIMFTGPTGANAVEAALKLARKITGRSNVISFTNGFHGMTLGALAATGNGYHRAAGGSSLPDVTRMPYDGFFDNGFDSADFLQQMLEDSSGGIDAPAAILLETVQGEGGLNAASPEWVRRIADMARAHGALLIIDDIQAGCGRCGTFFSFEEMDVEPDIVTMAKSVSGFGLPMALVLVKPEHDVFGPAEHNGTFRGNTHAFVTARVAIEKFWSDDAFQRELADKALMLTTALADIAAMLPGAYVKGRGLMQGVDVGTGELASDICARAFQNGLIVETSGSEDQVVKILAPLTTPQDTFAKGLSILTEAARDAAHGLKQAAE